MKYFSTFSGIGGFELAMPSDWECVGFSEIDKYAIQIYNKHFNHKNYGDITKIATEDIPDFDLLVGGFPCQSFSIAGKRRGFADTRGTLFFELARILKDKRPKYFVLKMLKDCYLITVDSLSKPSSPRLMNWGMIVNGKCLTARISESHRIGKECSLSDILEESVDQKYFLSEKIQNRLIEQLKERESQQDAQETLEVQDNYTR